ncbi:hypothetical protein J8M21_11180 [Pseudoalteromonas luteoviolacea]|uniref:hypothetical protein n=1 Tax=Pseudoalteromonas luteoviolacea TaxID=43657 RepID=UPI001B3A1735|nr:hypothetical protein [Pseudoalteromonas luteoviolacea]MBQ4877770.1 hypothetical protein [Pseudoalteromonas luteoviolacea]MBQ4906784.1 hypothetical protein [Pseudoalteromonas luteoviolacea]
MQMLNDEIKIDTPGWFKVLHLSALCIISILLATALYMGNLSDLKLTFTEALKALFYSYLVFTVFMNIKCLKYYNAHFVIKNNKISFYNKGVVTQYGPQELEFEQSVMSGVYKVQTAKGQVLSIMHSWLPGSQILVSAIGQSR